MEPIGWVVIALVVVEFLAAAGRASAAQEDAPAEAVTTG